MTGSEVRYHCCRQIRWMLAAATLLFWSSALPADRLQDLLQPLEGASVLLLDPDGQSVISIEADRALIPASTMKLVLSLLALEHWGANHRFETRFRLDDESRLWVIGQGDPFLVSEEIATIAKVLAGCFNKSDANVCSGSPAGAVVKELAADNSYFSVTGDNPWLADSDNPYDALPDALSANFNTVNLQLQAGVLISGEVQTPLTPVAKSRANEVGFLADGPDNKGRFNLGPVSSGRAALNFLQILEFLLKEHSGESLSFPLALTTSPGVASAANDLYVHKNSRTLAEVLEAMLLYSTNFIANQLSLALSAELHAKPGTFRGFDQVAATQMKAIPDWDTAVVKDGAGLSRDNRITTRQLIAVLNRLQPWHALLPQYRDNVFAKTGSLEGVSSLAGIIHPDAPSSAGQAGGGWRFALILNDPKISDAKLRDAVLDELQRVVNQGGQ